MKKIILMTIMMSAAAGAALFAGGSDDRTVPGRGYGMGYFSEDGVDLISVKGTVDKDSYGNLMLDKGKTNYLLTAVPTLGVTLKEGDAIEGEGFEGNTLYTKDGKAYQNFHLTMVRVNGEDYAIDLNSMGYGYGTGGAWGGMGYGGRGSRGGMMGYGYDGNEGWGRGGMMGWDNDENRAWGGMGRGFAPADGDYEETALEGTFTLEDGFHPALVTDKGNYLIMMGHWAAADIAEGANIEATGYAGRSLYTRDGEDYYSLILTSLKADGKEIDLAGTVPYGGMMGYGGAMGGRRR
ncbi:MAG: hypothetical protein JXA95_09895 [Spirochaetales bacterium]|nr:hypothetical protein [Spirochaetales bacterium]